MLRRLIGAIAGRRAAERDSARTGRTTLAPCVVFLTTGQTGLRIGADTEAYSPLASARLRMLIPARALATRLPVHVVPIDQLAADPRFERLGTPRAVVIGKLSTTEIITQRDTVRALLEWLRRHAAGLPVFADVCDDYAARARLTGEPEFQSFLNEVGAHCTLTVPCAALARRIAPVARKGVQVIEDPWESPRVGEVRTSASSPVRLCWFGVATPVALPALERALDALGRRFPDRPIEIELVTAAQSAEDLSGLISRVQQSHARLHAEFVSWSLEVTWAAIGRCDFVLLPQDTASDWGAVKSHNRLVESIRGGRLALASPIESYRELAEYAWVGDDLGEGLAWGLANPQQAAARVRAGQAYLPARFAPEAVGDRWASALGLVGHRAAAPLKLNLGCGDKILPGYVNVDIAPSRAGMAPDVLCDLRELKPFATGSADEVMAIHVVEHFWRWEVAQVLQEWVRVLRPGGRLVLECPNLHTACEEILRDPVAGARSGKEGQRTMWVLYGDPSWQDPLMCHRWNYTPQSLAELMREVGLVDVRQEPAQFKLREPRDMRLVGAKPRPR